MKKALWVFVAVSLATASLAQDGDQNGYTPASRSAHETVWRREVQTNLFGQVVGPVSSFVELATGLNHFDETTGQWQPSREEWEVYPDAIVARWGQHKAILSHNLADGALDVLLVDGETRLVATPTSLGIYDPVDGRQIVIAEVKDCAAERGAAPNEIVFRN